jgi:hypothetical protein
MAALWLDGFDHFGPAGQTTPSASSLMLADYQTAHGSLAIAAPLSTSGGYALAITNLANYGLAKSLPASGRLVGGFRFSSPIVASQSPNWSFELQHAGTTICSITFDGPAAKLSIRTGIRTGTILATAAAALLANSIHYLEWDITFGAASAYQVWLDGISIMSGTGNTGSGQTTADGFAFWANGTGSSITVDDLYVFDTTGAVNNAVVLTSPVVVTQYPLGDSQKQWTNAGNVILPAGLGSGMTGVGNTSGANNSPGANQLCLMRFVPAVACTLNSVGLQMLATSSTANFRATLYADSGGTPGALVATGTQVTGCTTGTANTLPFASGQALTAGTAYWLGYIVDTVAQLAVFEATTVSTLGQRKANTYSSGAPATGAGMTLNQVTWEIWGNCTGAAGNYSSILGNPANGTGPAGDNATINGSTVGAEDLYGFPALPGLVSTVYAVAVKAHVKRSDSGARTVDLHTVSGGTDGTGSAAAQTPPTSYGWQTSYFDTDPHTGAAWTATAVNTATHGPRIAS